MVQPLYIPPSKQGHTGLTVYCNRCKATVTDICKETGQPLKKCRFGDRHKFKVILYLPNKQNNRITRILKTRDVYEAIQEATKIEKDIKEGKIPEEIHKPIKEKEETPTLLIHCFAKYISHLHGEGVPIHLRKQRTTAHIKDIERAFVTFIEAIDQRDIDFELLKIDDLNDTIIGYIYEYLSNKNFSARTRNKYYSYGVSFLKWWQEEYYPIRNWFSRITRHEEVQNPQSIQQDEYERLLEIISKENGVKVYPSKTKPTRNYFKSYLKSAFKLGLLTGLRREELINLKWSDIYYDKNSNPLYIKIEDYKSNRIRHRENNKKFKYVPVSNSLSEMLSTLEHSEDKNNNEFILAPEIRSQRTKVMADNLSRAFSHYYEQLDTGKSLTFKSLRKAYITALKMYVHNPKEVTGHTENAVIEKHYIDREQIAISMKHFDVFPTKENHREKEIEQIRNSTIHNQKEKEK